MAWDNRKKMRAGKGAGLHYNPFCETPPEVEGFPRGRLLKTAIFTLQSAKSE